MEDKLKFTSYTEHEIYTALYQKAHEGYYTSYIRGKRCDTNPSFFREVSASFQFPSYFGENWAAVNDCLCDLEWLSFSGIFIVIEDFDKMFCAEPSFKKEDQDRLIRYLRRMIAYWESESIPIEIWINVTGDGSMC